MPFTNEEAKSIEFMVESYKLSKETFVFSEENDVLCLTKLNLNEENTNTQLLIWEV